MSRYSPGLSFTSSSGGRCQQAAGSGRRGSSAEQRSEVGATKVMGTFKIGGSRVYWTLLVKPQHLKNTRQSAALLKGQTRLALEQSRMTEPVPPNGFEAAYCWEVRRLLQQRPTLTLLFDSAKHANDARWKGVSEIPLRPPEDWPEIAEQVSIDDGAVHAYAAAVVLYLDDVLKRLRRSFKYRKLSECREALSKPIGGAYNIGDVIWAAANNVRHYDEWRRYDNVPRTIDKKSRAEEKNKQMKSIEVLAAVLGREVAPDGVNNGLGTMLAWRVLERLGKSYADIEGHVGRYAYEMVGVEGLEQSRFVLHATELIRPADALARGASGPK